MKNDNIPTEETFIVLGQNYKQACIMKYCCYKMAGFMGGTAQSMQKALMVAIDQMDHLTDFQIGVAFSLDLGATVPRAFIQKADLNIRLPGSELH